MNVDVIALLIAALIPLVAFAIICVCPTFVITWINTQSDRLSHQFADAAGNVNNDLRHWTHIVIAWFHSRSEEITQPNFRAGTRALVVGYLLASLSFGVWFSGTLLIPVLMSQQADLLWWEIALVPGMALSLVVTFAPHTIAAWINERWQRLASVPANAGENASALRRYVIVPVSRLARALEKPIVQLSSERLKATIRGLLVLYAVGAIVAALSALAIFVADNQQDLVDAELALAPALVGVIVFLARPQELVEPSRRAAEI